MSAFRSRTAATCVCVAAALAALAPDGGAAGTKAITFKKGDVSKGLRECPGGKAKVELTGGAAQLADAQTGKRLGVALTHDRAEFNVTKSVITCWAFSPDGKLVATGSRCQLRDGSEGQLCVWDVATGKRVAQYRGGQRRDERIGNVLGVAFGADGGTVLFKANGFQLDGP